MNVTPPAARYFAADQSVRNQFERAFSYSLRLANGTLRYTYPGRMNDLNSWVESLLPVRRPLRILDVGISSGISTLEWVSSLERSGIDFEMTAGDLFLTGRLLTLGRRWCLLTDDSGYPLQYAIGDHTMPNPPGRRNSALFFLPLMLLRWAYRVALARSHAAVDAGVSYTVLRRLVRLSEIDFVVPALRTHPAVHLVRDDLLHPRGPREGHDVIRAANILNPCYFSTDELRTAIRNLVGRLSPEGLLIIGRTTHDEVNKATAFIRSSRGALEIASRINGGIEVEDLIWDMRTQRQPAVTRSCAVPDRQKDRVRSFWNDRPCGAQFGGAECGSRLFFERLERHRYQLEPHILRAADFGRARGLRVLEIGCGLGTDAVQFARAGAHYTGIDLTPRAISLARKRFSLLDLPGDLHVGDAEALDFDDDSFDLVYSHGVLHHTPDIHAAVKEISRVLRPGGRAVVMLYHRRSLNHHIKVRLLRRLRVPLLKTQWGLALVHRLWSEPLDELRMHARYVRNNASDYLRPDVFLSRNTDGAACPVSRVYSVAEAHELFHAFVNVQSRTYSRMPAWWPRGTVWRRAHSWIGSRWGWHLWIFAQKPQQMIGKSNKGLDVDLAVGTRARPARVPEVAPSALP